MTTSTGETERIRGYLIAQAKKLTPAELVAKLRTDTAPLQAIGSAVPAAHFADRPSPDEWSAAEVYMHILDMNERGARAIEGILDEGAVPPSFLAGLLLEVGRREPDRLVACLAVADGAVVPKGEAPRGRRLLRVSLPLSGLAPLQAGAMPSWNAQLPMQYKVVELALDQGEQQAVLTICSDKLPPVPDGQPVPLLRLKH